MMKQGIHDLRSALMFYLLGWALTIAPSDERPRLAAAVKSFATGLR